MPNAVDTSLYDLPPAALIGAFAPAYGSLSRSQLISQIRTRIESGRAEQGKWARRFSDLYSKALESDWDQAFLVQWAAALLEKQRAALEVFHPLIEELQRRGADYSLKSDPEFFGLCLATIDLILGWITPYQTLCGQLLRLADERRTSSDILRARPVDGEIDHEALSREIIARFPKILAELAK